MSFVAVSTMLRDVDVVEVVGFVVCVGDDEDDDDVGTNPVADWIWTVTARTASRVAGRDFMFLFLFLLPVVCWVALLCYGST
jgi:hypothetical protein